MQKQDQLFESSEVEAPMPQMPRINPQPTKPKREPSKRPERAERYVVASKPGLIIQCQRGKLRPGELVVPSDVGGADVFAGLLTAGTIVRDPRA